jgi:hypothetical protein
MTDTLKPGQKHPTPTKGFGDRVFYETLLRQNPDSAMAQDWCIAHGVLSTKEAEKIYKTVLKRKKVSSTSSSAASSKSKAKAKSRGAKRKLVKEEADDVGMDVGGMNDSGIGGVTL